ncbi:PQ-loop domain-containing transporter [Sphingobium subterraneum]|uniref:Uncharacterized protein with PQ loop repeat n=1 Tax=Sphingobium subterraneum TaxID=627688 RepID=A0A841J9Q6_9SPHN|nr:PQ-loop domain-containing transporter [Sphingobium subterraneum]MBB6125288.1 uncharacterized protein with PQ loop repeat [Sphingobium subterraneum]
MNFAQAVSLVASILCTIAPGLQVLHILRTRSVAGLSVLTCVALVMGNCLAILIGVQYSLGLTLAIMILSLIIQSVMLHLVSPRAALATGAAVIAAIAGTTLLAPGLAADILTTRYHEQVAFLWGIIAATTFIPQVLVTRRTRQTKDLSWLTVITFAVGFTLWTTFAVMVRNWSLMLWCGILTLSVYELVRLKLAEKGARAVM